LSNKKLQVKYCGIRSYGLSVVKELGGEFRIIAFCEGSQELSNNMRSQADWRLLARLISTRLRRQIKLDKDVGVEKVEHHSPA
jgi:hypothetical protein